MKKPAARPGASHPILVGHHHAAGGAAASRLVVRPMTLAAAVAMSRRGRRQSRPGRAGSARPGTHSGAGPRPWVSSGWRMRPASVVMVAIALDRHGVPGLRARGQAPGVGRAHGAALRADPAPAVGLDRRGVRRRSLQHVRVPRGDHPLDLRARRDRASARRWCSRSATSSWRASAQRSSCWASASSTR